MDLIVTQKIWVYRSGCRIPKDIRKVARKFGVNENFYDLCWARLISMLEMKLAQEMIIPVMDGFQKTTVRSFSQLVKNMDLMRAADMDKIMSIKNTENILGEVFYADSKYGVFTQMVDIVAYLRNVTDCAREGKPLADFKKKLLKISEKLSPVIVQEKICVFGKTNNFTANCERRTTSDEN